MMKLDFFTTFIITSTIVFTISIATFIFSFIRPENRAFIWASLAGLLFSISFICGTLRNVISDFYSIVIFNFLIIIAMLSYLELFCRILSVFPRRRYLLLILPAFQFISFIWLTYYVPNYQARVIIFNIIILIISYFIIRVLIISSKKAQILSHLFSAIPFMIIGLISFYKLILVIIINSAEASSFTSISNVIPNFIHMLSTVWATFSAIFLISNRVQYELVQSARIDSLTNTMNRTGLQESLEKEIAQNQRCDESLSLIISDLDFFKNINDSYGHMAGDAMLVHVANLFKKNIRTCDHLARYGGEEFVIILPRANLEEAQGLAERLRTVVKSKPLEYGKKKISITCSFGVAFFNKKNDNYDSLLDKADTALYNAKDAGRDRVILYNKTKGN